MHSMGESNRFSIGKLANRTGLPVKTIRFYSDSGLLPPTDRTSAGYRRYDVYALTRLELVRTLRELGFGLADVRTVLDEQAGLPDLAARHLEALEEQIRDLRLRRSVLRAVVKRESEWEEVRLMNKLASMSDDQRKQLVDEFWDEVNSGLDIDPDFERRMRSGKPQLPDDPTPEQLEAWIEFAELVQDADFRTAIRRMSEGHAAARERGESMNPSDQPDWCEWFDRADAAIQAGTAPESAEGKALADEFAAGVATEGDGPADPRFRQGLIDKLSSGGDPRAERYWQLLATINGWPAIPTRQPAVNWLVAALRDTSG